MRIKLIFLYFIFFIAFYSDAIATVGCNWVAIHDNGIPPVENKGKFSRLYEYDMPPGTTATVYFTNNGNKIPGTHWKCTNKTDQVMDSSGLLIPDKYNGLVVTDIEQNGVLIPVPPKEESESASISVSTTVAVIDATLQTAAFNDDGEMLPLNDWLDSQEDIFPNLVLDIPDFTRTDENGPLYFCVPLNKLILKELLVPSTEMNSTYQVENGKIIQLNSGNGPSPEELEDFYLSTEKCNLNGSFGTSVTLLSNGEKWGNDNPFNGEVQLITKHKILLIELNSVSALVGEEGIKLAWQTNRESKNAGFRIWRGIKNGIGGYETAFLREFSNPELVDPEPDEDCLVKIEGQLKETNPNQNHKLISAIGNSIESTCYSFTDTTNLSDGTYYYLLEDINDDGKSTFHCNYIDAVTIGQGLPIDLPSAINSCKEMTGSED